MELLCENKFMTRGKGKKKKIEQHYSPPHQNTATQGTANSKELQCYIVGHKLN